MVNAVELAVNKGGEWQPCGVWNCGQCGILYGGNRGKDGFNQAEECCKPWFCECGQPAKRWHTYCESCERSRYNTEQAAKERAAFDKATKITVAEYAAGNYPEMVFDPTNTYGDSDGWLRNIDEICEEYDDALDEWKKSDETENKPKLPEYVWASLAVKPTFDVDILYEQISQEASEDYQDHIVDDKELEKYLAEWMNKQPSYFEIDYSTAILLNEAIPNE